MTTCKANTGRLFCCCFGLCNQFHLATCKYTLVACRTNNKAELASGRGSLLWKSLCKCASVTAASHFSSSFSKTPRRRWPARLRSMPHKWSSLSSEFTEAISNYAENTNAQHGQSRHLMIFMQPAPHYKVHVTSTTRRNWLGNCRELAVCAPCAFYTGSLKQKMEPVARTCLLLRSTCEQQPNLIVLKLSTVYILKKMTKELYFAKMSLELKGGSEL